jgi:UDP-glucose 4-epimerase
MESIKDNKIFTLFGNNLNTDDGTCVRDYIHVADIARAHRIAAEPRVSNGFYNLSTGLPASNLEIITKCCEISNSKPQAVVEESRRPGDPDILIASADKFKSACNWQPLYHVDDIIEHAWKWYTRDVT